MPLATLQTVDPGHRKFETKFGQMAAFDVSFTDGRSGQVVTKIETLGARQAQYQDLIGKETEFVIEDNGTWPDGNPKPLKVKLPFGPGGGQGHSSARPPRDEDKIQQAMDRRTALMQAVAADTEAWEPIANQMYDWLRKTAGGEVHGEGASSPATQSTPVGQGNAGEKPGADDGAAVSADGGGPHVHYYERIPNVTKFLRCVCGATEKA